MASVFVTGSSDGVGQETARQLVRGGHRVVPHARDDARAKETAAARHRTADGGERIFAVNVLGPYLLTALMPLPARLVDLSSGLQAAGRVAAHRRPAARLAGLHRTGVRYSAFAHPGRTRPAS